MPLYTGQKEAGVISSAIELEDTEGEGRGRRENHTEDTEGSFGNLWRLIPVSTATAGSLTSDL